MDPSLSILLVVSLSAYDARWSRRHFTNLPTDLEIDRVCSRKAQTANQLLQVKLINFSKVGEPLVLKIMNFARNDQAFIQGNAKDQQAFNRPLNVRFGPDGCAWVVATSGIVIDHYRFSVPENNPGQRHKTMNRYQFGPWLRQANGLQCNGNKAVKR